MNIKFEYLYRDAANYKQFGQVVLHNCNKLEISEVTKRLSQYLIDGEFFESQKVPVPTLEVHKFDPQLDHAWYEFDSVCITSEPIDHNIDILDFIESFK